MLPSGTGNELSALISNSTAKRLAQPSLAGGAELLLPTSWPNRRFENNCVNSGAALGVNSGFGNTSNLMQVKEGGTVNDGFSRVVGGAQSLTPKCCS